MTRIDRLARSTFDLFAIVKRIVNAGAQFRSPAEPLADTSTSAGQIVTLFGGVARAALIMCSVYVIGLIVPWFMPEPAGEPLPE